MSRLLSIDIEPIIQDGQTLTDVVTSAQAKDYAVLGDNFDNWINIFIASARMKLERYTALVFIPSTIKALYAQEGCGDRILLGYCNNMDSLKDGDGNDLPADIILKGYGNQLYLDTTRHEVTLSYTAGFATGTAPEIIKHAVLKQIAWDTIHFGDENSADVCPEAKNLLSQFRAYVWE